MTLLLKNWGNVWAKPFLKWAGGKGQLVPQLVKCLPPELQEAHIKRYVEPFLGGGALFFHIAQTYELEDFFISDANPELFVVYKVIQQDVEGLIKQLSEIQNWYFRMASEQQSEFYYNTRQKFNSARLKFDFAYYSHIWVERAAQILFLNRTCFNGLFRLNSKAEFNVPFGDYKNPTLCDTENLRTVSAILQKATLQQSDFSTCREFVDEHTFVYFDPPYRPLSKTASFTAYSSFGFDDGEQLRLARFYRELAQRKAKLMLSNSDPKNIDAADNFFEEAYAGFNISRLKASRMINSNAQKRGEISELLITNY